MLRSRWMVVHPDTIAVSLMALSHGQTYHPVIRVLTPSTQCTLLSSALLPFPSLGLSLFSGSSCTSVSIHVRIQSSDVS